MLRFLSEDTLRLHREHIEKRRLEYSIFEKSIGGIKGKELSELKRMRFCDREEVLKLKCEIIAHDLYFSSFGNAHESSEMIRRSYHTEASFIYEVQTECCKADGGFIFIYTDGRCVRMACGAPTLLLRLPEPRLALDLCEHAYFLDYGFDREAYIRNALKYLNLNKI